MITLSFLEDHISQVPALQRLVKLGCHTMSGDAHISGHTEHISWIP